MRMRRLVFAVLAIGAALAPAAVAPTSAGAAGPAGSTHGSPAAPAARAADTPPALIVDVLLGTGYISTEDGPKDMGFHAGAGSNVNGVDIEIASPSNN